MVSSWMGREQRGLLGRHYRVHHLADVLHLGLQLPHPPLSFCLSPPPADIGERQSGLQGSPLHRGTPYLFPLTLSCSHSHLHKAGTFCCPLQERAVPLLGSQGCSPLLSCSLPSSPAHLLVPAAQRFPFLLGQHKVYTCFAPGLALITSHNCWDQIQECSAWILPNT